MTDNNGRLARFNAERKNWKTFKKQMKRHKIINEGNVKATKAFQTPESVTE